ncbi:MAG: hypothetical protein ACI92S_002017 [Planctomycetaceae bacterium]|jgi:hypothetical protein
MRPDSSGKQSALDAATMQRRLNHGPPKRESPVGSRDVWITDREAINRRTIAGNGQRP